MNRRDFLTLAATGAIYCRSRRLLAAADKPLAFTSKADFTIHIGPVSTELAPNRIVKTVGYNGCSPGPILRMREGRQVSVDVFNDTEERQLIHWHGQLLPSDLDGSLEEGTPDVPPRGHRRYDFTPRPAGSRWYHSHACAGRDLHRGLYTGQFGFLYIEPKNEDGKYDRECFLALRDWGPFFTAEEEDPEQACMPPDGPRMVRASYQVPLTTPENGLEVGYRAFSINDRALGYGEPIRVRTGERVLFHFLNASATEIRKIALPGHSFTVIALDGNPVPRPASVETIQIAPAERVDAIVDMNQPGVWVLGTTNDEDREDGMGTVVEYANRSGTPRWFAPATIPWDYRSFGLQTTEAAPRPDEIFPLIFKKVPGGRGGFNRWLINGKSFPETDPILIRHGLRYRLIFENHSDDTHAVHLHRHIFELTKIDGMATSGVKKDTVMVKPNRPVEVDFVADNPGLTLFHCHQQLHMDFGFMTLLKYI